MPEYIYKGFKVSYDIKQNDNNKLYQAEGSVICCTNKKKQAAVTQKFQTEHSSKAGVQQEIKKIIHDYIDFEWKEFFEMQDEL